MVLKLRSRQVSFRVTDEEYEGLRSASSQRGARCLSDYARIVMLRQGSQDSPVDDVAHPALAGHARGQMRALDHRITALEASFTRLMSLIPGLWDVIESRELEQR